MPITHVGSATGGGTSSTSKTATIPTVAVNDLLLLFCVNKGSTAVPTVSDDDGGSWARMDGSGTNGCSIWYRRATSATSGKTITASGFTTDCSIGLTVLRGVTLETTFWDSLQILSQAAGTESVSTFTPDRSNSWIGLSVFHRGASITNASQTCTNPGTLNERFDQTSAGGCGVMHAGAVQTSASAGATGTITWTATNSGHITIVFAIRPAMVTGGNLLGGAMLGRARLAA